MTAAPLPHDSPVARLLSKLARVKQAGRGKWMARCPAHDDQTASLSIAEGSDGRVLVSCKASCQTTAVVAAIGLRMSDLFAGEPPRPAPTPAPVVRSSGAMVKSYDYVDADGTLLFQACRFREPDGKKTFRQRRPDGSGGWIWSLGDVAPVLYRLPEVMSAVESGQRVFVVEGEKDADALAELGYTATTAPMGAGKWHEAFATVLKGADVVVLPDNDPPGASHAEQVAASCLSAGAIVKVVPLPDLPPKGDVSDWLDAGHDIDALEELVARTPRYTGDEAAAKNRTRWRLDELLDNESIMRPPPVIVPRMAWAGRSTLVAAPPKAGKSTLTGYLTASVSKGGYFLNERCAKGPVLVIGLEEFIGDTARRLKSFDADGRNVHLVNRFLGEPEMKPDELAAHIEAVDPVLVILDSLSAYARGLAQDDNNASQMQAVVQPMTDVAHATGASLLIVHHATKATGKYRGSSAIGGGVDVLCEFEVPKLDTDPTMRRVRTLGRVPVPPLYEIRFDGYTYALTTGAEAPIDERIVAVVTARPTCSGTDVVEALGARRQDVLARITLMLADGRLKNQGSGHILRLIVPGNPLNPSLL